MRTFSILLCTLGLFASEPLRIVAVERQGLPPYEDDHRIYRLQGSARVSPNELLELSRPGGKALPGRLRVLRATPEGALATLDRRGDTFPLKGDVAIHFEMAVLPGLPASREIAPAPTPLGTRLAIPRDPRYLGEAVYFLPGDATLSPLGREKLRTWAQEYGEGRWILEIPSGKGPSARLDSARAKVLKAALEGAGVKGVQIKAVPSSASQRPNSVFVRYQEGAPPKGSGSPKA